VSEKVDGSIAVLYWYSGEWHVSSSSVPDGSSAITKDTTFAELFWEIWKNNGYMLPINKNFTFVFEMFTPRNTIVVKPERETIVLHGVRNNETYEELDPAVVAKQHNWESVTVYEFSSLESMLAACNQLNPAKQEGFVVRDAYFNRIKVKSAQYVALSHLSISGKVTLNAKHMLQIVKTNEGSEFLAYFPEYLELFKVVSEAFENLVESLVSIVEGKEKEVSAQLEQFAKKIDKNYGSEDIREYLKNYKDLEQLLSLLSLKLEEEPTGESLSAADALKNRKLQKQQKKLEKKQKKKNNQ
jgi:hypothetical protein